MVFKYSMEDLAIRQGYKVLHWNGAICFFTAFLRLPSLYIALCPIRSILSSLLVTYTGRTNLWKRHPTIKDKDGYVVVWTSPQELGRRSDFVHSKYSCKSKTVLIAQQTPPRRIYSSAIPGIKLLDYILESQNIKTKVISFFEQKQFGSGLA